MRRDSRIDTIRGIAMVTIIINHFSLLSADIGMTGPQIPTATTVSLSSAAEIFVSLSGYMVGMVYLQKTNPTELLLRRSVTLYLWNSVLFIAAALLTRITDQNFNKMAHLTPIVTSPVQAVAYFSTMTYAPYLIDILHLYVILLLASPVAVWLTRRSPLLLVAVSMTVYLLFQVFVRIYPVLGNSPSPLQPGAWGCHPLAWQMIFFVAMAGGSIRLHERIFGLLETQRSIVWALLAIFTLVGTFKVVADLPYIPFTDRGTLGPLRAAHSLLVLLLYAGLVTALKEYLNSAPFRSLALIGRHSLNAFLFSTVLTFLALFVWQQLALGWIGYLAITTLVIVATWAAAKYWDKRKFDKA